MAETSTMPNPTLDDDDREIEEMRRQVMEMEQDLQRETDEIEATTRSTVPGSAVSQIGQKKPDATTAEDSSGAVGVTTQMDTSEMVLDDDPDGRSVYVGNVDYGATPEEIQAHFASCGTINRVTILLDKFTGHPKGYAYVEFAQPAHVEAAVVLNESLFRGRLIKVTAKRTNIPAFMRGRGRGRGGYRGGRGAHSYGYSPYGSRPPRGRGRGRGF